MKGDGPFLLLLLGVATLLPAVAGADWVVAILHAISHWLLALPAPTDSWAQIVRAVAWPLVLFYFLSRYRGHVRRVLDTMAERLKKDKVKLGPFELTSDSQVITLDPEDVNESTETFTAQDVERIERFFEFITEQANFGRLADWVSQNVDPNLDIGSFLTEPPYANQREQAFQALIG